MKKFFGHSHNLPGESACSNNFRISRSAQGDPVYEWIDCSLVNLSSMKLWDILSRADQECCAIDQDFIAEVERELRSRDHFEPEFPWKRPH